ncbi:MAG: hypothetical protein EOO41_00870 [Methanobacteriota archaeon]|nr:MAG: hypothetical protein EOO41_00870 [Euryarchaeota archaeon]
MQAEVMAARQARGEVEKVIRAEYDAQRSIFEQEVRDAKEAAERQVAQAHEQVEKLSESLNSLNAVFQKLRGEEDLLKVRVCAG